MISPADGHRLSRRGGDPVKEAVYGKGSRRLVVAGRRLMAARTDRGGALARTLERRCQLIPVLKKSHWLLLKRGENLNYSSPAWAGRFLPEPI
jgi:hypothetical protein